MPRDITKEGGINSAVKFCVGKWGLIIVNSKICCPETKNENDDLSRCLIMTDSDLEVGKFELEAIIVWLPVMRLQI